MLAERLPEVFEGVEWLRPVGAAVSPVETVQLTELLSGLLVRMLMVWMGIASFLKHVSTSFFFAFRSGSFGNASDVRPRDIRISQLSHIYSKFKRRCKIR